MPILYHAELITLSIKRKTTLWYFQGICIHPCLYANPRPPKRPPHAPTTPHPSPTLHSLELDRPRRFTRRCHALAPPPPKPPFHRAQKLTVIRHATHALHLIHNTRADPLQEIPVEAIRGRGHEVRRPDRAQRDHLLVDAPVAHDAHDLRARDADERLADVAVQARGADLRDEDGVRVARDAQLRGRDLAQDADAQPRPGERVPPHQGVREAEAGAEGADLVLEELAQGLEELEVHGGREAADVVVRFDGGGGAFEGDGLDDVRVEGPLKEEVDGACGGGGRGCGGEGAGRLLEDVDEEGADDFALALRVRDAGEGGEEARGGVDDVQVDAEVGGEGVVHGGGLALAQQAVVDEHGVEARADGGVQQLGRDGGVDAAGDGADDLPRGADACADARDLLVAEGGHRPVLARAADGGREVAEQGTAAGGVGDFGVKLDAVEGARVVGDAGEGGVWGGGDGVEGGREARELVAVGHPDGVDGGGGAHVGEERGDGAGGAGREGELGVAVLAFFAREDVLAEVPGNLLQPVADAEDGDGEVEDGGVDVRGGGLVDGVGPAGEDDAFGGPGEVRELLRAGQHLGVDIQVAESTGDEVRVLGAEVQHEDRVEGLVRLRFFEYHAIGGHFLRARHFTGLRTGS